MTSHLNTCPVAPSPSAPVWPVPSGRSQEGWEGREDTGPRKEEERRDTDQESLTKVLFIKLHPTLCYW